jgi:hypothetical protein
MKEVVDRQRFVKAALRRLRARHTQRIVGFSIRIAVTNSGDTDQFSANGVRIGDEQPDTWTLP